MRAKHKKELTPIQAAVLTKLRNKWTAAVHENGHTEILEQLNLNHPHGGATWGYRVQIFRGTLNGLLRRGLITKWGKWGKSQLYRLTKPGLTVHVDRNPPVRIGWTVEWIKK